MSINADLLENKLEDIDGNLEEIKALNETIIEFIEKAQDIKTDIDAKLLKNKANKIIYFAYIINQKADFISSEIAKLISCPQQT